MPKPSGRFGYRSVRQHHIGDALEALEQRGLVGEWCLEFAPEPTGPSRWPPAQRHRSEVAWWEITDPVDGSCGRYQTREAEQYILSLCTPRRIEWVPVPSPGGIAAGRPVWEYSAQQAHQGADVLAYPAIEEHLKWEGVYFPPLPDSTQDAMKG